MTLKNRLIAAGVGTSLVVAASIAAAQAGGETMQRTIPQATESRSQTIDHVSRMIVHRNRMMAQ